MMNFTSTFFTTRKNYFKNCITTLALLLGLVVNSVVFGQINIPSATSVTQNFNGTVTGQTVNLPLNWKMSPAGDSSPTWSNGGNFTATNISANSGSPATGGRYNWGDGTTTTDRAVGFMTSGGYNNPNSVMAYYQNTSGVQINDLTIAFDYERYRINSAACSITFFTSTDGSTWTARTAGDSGAFSTGSNAYNFTTGTVVNKSFTLTAINIPNNGNIYLRWNFNTTGGSSQGVGLDNVSLTASVGSIAPTVNGAIAANEYGVHTNGSNQQTSGSTVTYMTWDDTNLYLGVSGANTSEAFVLYLDKDPQALVNGGTNANGTNVGFNYDGTSFAALQYRADLVMYVKNDYREYRTADGNNGWSAATAGFGSYAETGGNVREFSIPWSAMGGKPSAFNFFNYITSNTGFVFGQTPTENVGGSIGTSARYARYYTVSSTATGSSTLPFSRNSYVFNSVSDISSFGPITAYDFTMNTAGRFLSRTGSTADNWVIGGNLNVGDGIIYLGSGTGPYGSTAVTGNLNITGGTFDMDATSGAVSVSGNVSVSLGATLKLSSTVGGDLNIAGNWSSMGTFIPNTRLVTFNGTVAQTLTGATTFDYLRINNATGLTLQTSSPVTINTEMNLSSGKVTLGANNFIMGSAATFINQSATSYLVTNNTGALVRNSFGNTAKPFPVGLVASYTPLTVANTGTVNDLSLVVSSPPTNAVTDAAKIVNLQWNLNSSGNGSVVNATFNWNTPSNVGGSYSAAGTGELGNYTTGPNYAITSMGTMAGTSKAVTGIALTTGSNRLVIGNTGAVYTPPPANDDCAGAIAITLDALAVAGSVLKATQSIPAINCSSNTGNSNDDVWYSFETSVAGDYTIKVVGSASFDAVIDVRSGTCDGTNIFCTDANGNGGTETVIATGLTAETIYYVRVYDYDSDVPSTPTFTIAVTSPPATLSTNGTTTLTYANQNVLTQSVSQTFNLSGNALTGAPGNITVTAPNTDFQVSNDDSTWGATTTIAYTSATLTATPVYVRFTPQTFGAKTGNVTFSGAGVLTPPTIALTGTGVLPAPEATAATSILKEQFNANWKVVDGANDGYLLDVSTSNNFGTGTLTTLNEGFETGLAGSYTTGNRTLGTGVWSFVDAGLKVTGAGLYNSGLAASQMKASTGTTTSPTLDYVGTVSFYARSNSGNTTMTIKKIVNSVTTDVTTFTVTNSWAKYSVDVNEYSTGVKIVFAIGSTFGYLDDISITYGFMPSFVTGYNAKPISGQSTVTSIVNGLIENTQYYYRLRAKSGSVISANSNTIAVKTAIIWDGATWSNGFGPNGTINAEIKGSYNSDPTINGTFTANNLTITSGSLTVKSGTNIALVGFLENKLTAADVVIENNANLIQENDVDNIGDITVNRNSSAIKRFDYTLWSSPVTGQGLYAFSPFTFGNRFYVYDSTTDKYSNDVGFDLINLKYPPPLVAPNGIDGKDNNNVPFLIGTGYLIRIRGDFPTAPTTWTGIFTGVPNNGDVPLSVTNGTFNAIGNPYPSTIFADDFITANGITEALYFWRKTNNTDQANNPTTSYATYTFAGGTGTDANTDGGSSIIPNGIIQVGQGFIVKSTSSTINFTNSMRIANNENQFLKTNPVERNRIWLNLTTAEGAFSQMMVAYMTGATQGVDPAIDGKFFNDSPMALNSFLNNEEYVIQGRALPFDAADVVPLVFKTEGAGSYIISIDHVDGLFSGNQDIFLKDKFTGIETNLKTSSYAFTTEAGNFTSRFDITYQAALSVNPTMFNENSVVVYKQNQDLIINSGTTTMSNVKVYDIQGRLLVNQKNINATQTKISSVATNQILLVKITSTENSSVTKKVMY